MLSSQTMPKSTLTGIWSGIVQPLQAGRPLPSRSLLTRKRTDCTVPGPDVRSPW